MFSIFCAWIPVPSRFPGYTGQSILVSQMTPTSLSPEPPNPQATACLIRENEPRLQALTEPTDRLGTAEQELVEVPWDEVEHIDGEYAPV